MSAELRRAFQDAYKQVFDDVGALQLRKQAANPFDPEIKRCRGIRADCVRYLRGLGVDPLSHEEQAA